MKKTIVLIFLIIFAYNILYSSESDQLDNDELLKDKKKFTGMMTAGIILTSIGSAMFAGGITMGIIHQIDPYFFPFTLHYINERSSGYVTYRYEIHFNPVVLALNLTGIILLAVGIPLTAVGGVKRKRINKKLNALLNNKIIPEVSYYFNSNSILIGARLRL